LGEEPLLAPVFLRFDKPVPFLILPLHFTPGE
jgi:hypothetical protein